MTQFVKGSPATSGDSEIHPQFVALLHPKKKKKKNVINTLQSKTNLAIKL